MTFVRAVSVAAILVTVFSIGTTRGKRFLQHFLTLVGTHA